MGFATFHILEQCHVLKDAVLKLGICHLPFQLVFT